jgi:hypothetical protein
MLATAAAGVSFRLNVPAEPRAGAAAGPTAKNGTRQNGAGPGTETRKVRDAAKLDRLWDRYADVDLENEPIEDAWARAHRDLLSRVTVAARQSLFAGAPEPPQVILGMMQCRTVRCRFSLCGPMAHEVRLLSATIQRLAVEDVPLWRHYSPVVAVPGDAMSADDFCLEVTVAFHSDDPDLTQIVFADER